MPGNVAIFTDFNIGAMAIEAESCSLNVQGSQLPPWSIWASLFGQECCHLAAADMT